MNMGSADQINLDLYLAQAANPLDVEVNDEAIGQLVHLMKDNKETIGFVLRFFGHKIQSPHELEALKAINVIQTLVKRSDRKFIEEVGKFRFLNELIKVISPKYLAQRSPDRVKKKIIELLYLWSIELKHEPKIFEAYQMLKRQGIITSDPAHLLPESKPIPPPPPRPKDEIWDNAENALMLKRLIQSGQPEDRIAANKLIKMLAHQADKKTEIKSRCQTELELARNNGKLFSEVLANFNSSEGEHFTEKELLDELYDSCKKLRPKLFKLAGELSETEPLFEELLKVNDELTKVINEYDVKVNQVPQPIGNDNNTNPDSGNLLWENSPIRSNSSKASTSLSTTITSNNNLVDISSPTTESSSSSSIITSTAASLMTSTNSIPLNGSHFGDVSLLSDHEAIKDNSDSNSAVSLPPPTTINNNSETMSTLFEMFPKTETQGMVNAHVNYLKDILVPCMHKPPNVASIVSKDLLSSSPFATPTSTTITEPTISKSPKRSTSCLDELENMMRLTLNAGPKPENCGDSNMPLNALRTMINIPTIDKQSTTCNQMNNIINPTIESNINQSDLLISLNSKELETTTSSTESTEPTTTSTCPSIVSSITDIFIPLESVEPSQRSPIILVNEKEIKSILNFGSNQPRSDVSVAVLTTTNLSNKTINKIYFHITSSKGMKFKFQAPSSTTLSPSSPFLPPSAITQVIIFAKSSPSKQEECQFHLEYSIETENFDKSGKVIL